MFDVAGVTVPLAEEEIDTFKVEFATDMVLIGTEEVKVGTVGPEVTVELVRK